jgi:outer membrane beta-barrel protein
MKTSLLALLAVLFLGQLATAETIKFPEEELATESVLPVFDRPVSVKNRTVTTAKRFELGLMGGMALNEPFSNPYSFGGEVTYHLDEDQAFNFYGASYIGGVSRYVGQINAEANANGQTLDLQNAPTTKYLGLLSYQYTAFYGKLSLTKNYVMNLGTYFLGGVGGIGIGDALEPVVGLGFGQKFYFSPNFAIRFDLRMLIYQGPDVITGFPAPTAGAGGEVSSSRFPKRIFTNSLMSLGAIYLIPNS